MQRKTTRNGKHGVRPLSRKSKATKGVVQNADALDERSNEGVCIPGKVVLEIGGHVVPSANPLMRMHWAKRKRLISDWSVMIVSAACTSGADTLATMRNIAKKKRVTMYRGSPRLIDRANCWLGFDKLILDNLTKQGLIVDDSEKWCEPVVEQVKGDTRTVIVIEVL